MPYGIYTGWGLVVPAALAVVYCAASARAMEALGAAPKPTPGRCLRTSLPLLAVFLLWSAAPFPLAVFYVLVFAGRLPSGLGRREGRLRALFFTNLTHLLSISLHMILIGAAALATDTSMRTLLMEPLWRIATLSAVLAANIAGYAVLLGRGVSLAVVRTQADSGEMRPFMAFLWFCNLSLLLDSILCSSGIQWDRLPLFLVGGTLLLELYLFRFLKHLYSILKVHYLEEEHRRLKEALEHQDRKAEELRARGDLDALTGIYSRRYALDRMGELLEAGEPFSLAYLDLDKLKQINDREGHQAGDRYLIHFAALAKRALRKSDLFARLGGDEFVVLLPGCGRDMAVGRMEQLRAALAQEGCCGCNFAFSFGVAEAPGDGGADPDALLRQADAAMYRDKRRPV